MDEMVTTLLKSVSQGGGAAVTLVALFFLAKSVLNLTERRKGKEESHLGRPWFGIMPSGPAKCDGGKCGFNGPQTILLNEVKNASERQADEQEKTNGYLRDMTTSMAETQGHMRAVLEGKVIRKRKQAQKRRR